MKERMDSVKMDADVLMACDWKRLEKKFSSRIIRDIAECADNEYVLYISLLSGDEVSVLVEMAQTKDIYIPATIMFHEKEYKVTEVFGYNTGKEEQPMFYIPKYVKEIVNYGRANYYIADDNEFLRNNGRSVISQDGKMYYLAPNWEQNDQNIQVLGGYWSGRKVEAPLTTTATELMSGAVWVDEWDEGKVVLPPSIKVMHTDAVQGERTGLIVLMSKVG